MSNRPLEKDILDAIRDVYGVREGPIPLHAPVFGGNEQAYVSDTIESTFVSSVGTYVSQFEDALCRATGAAFAVATVNGTIALQLSLLLGGVRPGDLVVTQSLSFVATANAACHAGAQVAFIDIDHATLGMSPAALRGFLEGECEVRSDQCFHKPSGKRIAACVPMHTFGHPVELAEIGLVCEEWRICLIEDAAEALGSLYRGRHCGTFGLMGILSFNGNKIVTTGGGGAILTDDAELARRAKHLTTTAKLADRWRFLHDEIGYNFRMPNLNAALGCAQLERLDEFVAFKRGLADRYRERFEGLGVCSVSEPASTRSSYWLCAILLRDATQRDAVLKVTNDNGVQTRPVWEPLHELAMYRSSPRGPLPVTLDISARLVNIPSGFREGALLPPVPPPAKDSTECRRLP